MLTERIWKEIFVIRAVRNISCLLDENQQPLYINTFARQRTHVNLIREQL
jgi:hypothetical protein